jgi:hypothetical protein
LEGAEGVVRGRILSLERVPDARMTFTSELSLPQATLGIEIRVTAVHGGVDLRRGETVVIEQPLWTVGPANVESAWEGKGAPLLELRLPRPLDALATVGSVGEGRIKLYDPFGGVILGDDETTTLVGTQGSADPWGHRSLDAIERRAAVALTEGPLDPKAGEITRC